LSVINIVIINLLSDIAQNFLVVGWHHVKPGTLGCRLDFL